MANIITAYCIAYATPLVGGETHLMIDPHKVCLFTKHCR